MSEDRWRIELDNTIADDEAQQIRSGLAAHRQVAVRSAKRELGLGAELSSIVPVAALVISAANLALAITKQSKESTKEKRIDLERFQQLMETELAKLGLLDCKIVSIDNFSAITDSTSEPCHLAVTTGVGELVKLSVRREHNTLRFSRMA
jgi:hypothetical protein